MLELCAKCNVCGFMPVQTVDRTLYYVNQDAPVLVIDDTVRGLDMLPSVSILCDLLSREVEFTYTNAIRCWYHPGSISLEQEEVALQSCSVWTRQLLDNRHLILSTKRGLRQLGMDREEGEAFRSNRLGLVLVIPRVRTLVDSLFTEYQHRVQRMLKEARLI